MGEGDNLAGGGNDGRSRGWARDDQGGALSGSGGVALHGSGDLGEGGHGSWDTWGENGLLDSRARAVGDGQSLRLSCSVSDALEGGGGGDWADSGGLCDDLGDAGGEWRIGSLGLGDGAWAVGDGQDSGLGHIMLGLALNSPFASCQNLRK